MELNTDLLGHKPNTLINWPMQSRAFPSVGPLVWNGLQLALQTLPRVFSKKFFQPLKTTLFSSAGVGGASE